MGHISEILERAKNRGKDLPYEGALLPIEAYAILCEAPGSTLVDVRTRAELDWVGRIPGSIAIEWMNYPGMRPNPFFLNQLGQQVDSESLILFICRSGHRSHNAAAMATHAGYTACYNVLEGFEGDKDPRGRRGRINGWRHADLPWEQG